VPDPVRSHCLICGSQRLQPFLNLAVEGVLHGAPEHNFTYVYRIMTRCGECGHGQLEKYSHDCFHYEGDEDWDMYWWYVLRPADVARLRSLLVGCPDQFNAACECAFHQSLRASSMRLWGGVRHAVNPAGKISFAWVVIEEQADHVALQVDQHGGIGQAA
jgi:hypothetical protein